jgi:hypothetical protein
MVVIVSATRDWSDAGALEPGRQIIAAFLDLGSALGYVVQPEYELPHSTAAVDVAWLREAGQPPLVIYEVESRPTAGFAANASLFRITARSAVSALRVGSQRSAAAGLGVAHVRLR